MVFYEYSCNAKTVRYREKNGRAYIICQNLSGSISGRCSHTISSYNTYRQKLFQSIVTGTDQLFQWRSQTPGADLKVDSHLTETKQNEHTYEGSLNLVKILKFINLNYKLKNFILTVLNRRPLLPGIQTRTSNNWVSSITSIHPNRGIRAKAYH